MAGDGLVRTLMASEWKTAGPMNDHEVQSQRAGVTNLFRCAAYTEVLLIAGCYVVAYYPIAGRGI